MRSFVFVGTRATTRLRVGVAALWSASPLMPPRPDPSTPPPVTSGARRVTLLDIARAVGVTSMTVSRALRNQPRIAEATRLAIIAKADELGYQPDPVLSALVHYRKSRAQTTTVRSAIAWLNHWPDPRQLRKFREFDLYWQGATRSAEKMGFHLEEFRTGGDLSPERLAQILAARNVQGILMAPGLMGEPWFERFPWDRFAVVSLTRPDPRLPFHVVTPDQVQNAMLAFDKMRERGYRRIGLVSTAWQPRTFGAGVLWRQLWEPVRNRLPVCLINDGKPVENLRALERWNAKHRPDAILTDAPDLPAMLEKLGVRAPRDLGLATLTVLDCPIDAGIYQNPEEIGRVGVLVLASLINDRDRGIPAINRKILIEGRWVDGSSLPMRG